MALGTLHPFTSNVHYGNPGPSADRQTHRAFKEMSYPPPPQNMVSPDMGLPHSELPGPYSIPSQSESGSVDGNWTLQRSFSTPEGASMAEQAQAGASGEKKRNKLGYHRTSVACSHCRGRKIRCIPAAGDAQGRCASCIRLKRECSFKPTEQQRGTEARSRSAAQHVHMDQRSSQSSSPTPSGHAPSQPPAQRPFPPLATSTHHMRTPMSTAPIVDGPMAPLPAGQQYDFNQGVPSYVPSNINPYLESAPQNWNNPWHGAPLDSPVSEHPPDTPVSASWASGPASQETVWAGMTMPVRSMSYGGESLGNNAYGSLITGGRLPSGYANSSMPNSSVEGFQIDAGSTATMPSHNSMQWQQQPHPQIPQPGYGNWPHGDLNQIQTDGHRETASGVDG